jgi:hypothetical protein
MYSWWRLAKLVYWKLETENSGGYQVDISWYTVSTDNVRWELVSLPSYTGFDISNILCYA